MKSPTATMLFLSATWAVAGCGEDTREREDPMDRATERSRAVATAEWSYGVDTLPPEQGEREPRIVDRCRITIPTDRSDGTGANGTGADGPAPRTVDVVCGHLFIGLEADADSAWVDRLMEGLGVEEVERGEIPAWTTALEEPVRYLLVRVEPGREGRTLERALSSEGVRFVDVREVARRRP